MAINRYDLRKNCEQAEAITIGTMYPHDSSESVEPLAVSGGAIGRRPGVTPIHTRLRAATVRRLAS
jgi:hypothetical protein